MEGINEQEIWNFGENSMQRWEGELPEVSCAELVYAVRVRKSISRILAAWKRVDCFGRFLLSLQFACGQNVDIAFCAGIIVTQASAELVRIIG